MWPQIEAFKFQLSTTVKFTQSVSTNWGPRQSTPLQIHNLKNHFFPYIFTQGPPCKAPLNILYEQFSALGEKWRCRRPRRSLRPIPLSFSGPYLSAFFYKIFSFSFYGYMYYVEYGYWYRGLWLQQDLLSVLCESEAAVNSSRGHFQGCWVGLWWWDLMHFLLSSFSFNFRSWI